MTFYLSYFSIQGAQTAYVATFPILRFLVNFFPGISGKNLQGALTQLNSQITNQSRTMTRERNSKNSPAREKAETRNEAMKLEAFT